MSSKEVTIPYTCHATFKETDSHIAVTDIFDIQAGYVDGRPACIFTTREMSPEKQKLLSFMDRTVALNVLLTDKNSNVEYQSYETTNIRFIPNIFPTLSSVTLGKSQMLDSLDIHGSTSQLSSLEVSKKMGYFFLWASLSSVYLF